MSRKVGVEAAIDFLFKDVNVAGVRVVGAAETSKECSFNVVHRHPVRFHLNIVSTEVIQNGTFQSPKSVKGGGMASQRVIWTQLLNVEYSN